MFSGIFPSNCQWNKTKISSGEGTAKLSSSWWALPFLSALLFVYLFEEFKKIGCIIWILCSEVEIYKIINTKSAQDLS